MFFYTTAKQQQQNGKYNKFIPFDYTFMIHYTHTHKIRKKKQKENEMVFGPYNPKQSTVFRIISEYFLSNFKSLQFTLLNRSLFSFFSIAFRAKALASFHNA